MRPVRLEVSGFGAFRERVAIDFGDCDLVALVGPTGSGKSTVIDAITFALYGSVARYDDARAVAPVISALATEARVRLDFTVGPQAYTVVRVVRRAKQGASTREARLERGEEVLAGSVRELPAAVEALLGLDFAQFTKTVVLPQGEFAEFLHERPAERQKLLRRLFDLDTYARMGSAARTRAATAEAAAQFLREELAADSPVTEADLVRLRERIDLLDELAGRVRTDLERRSRLAEEAATLGRNRHEIDGQLTRVVGISGPADLDRVGGELAAAEAAAAHARHRSSEAEHSRRQADAAVGAGPDRSAIRAGIAAWDRLDGAESELADALGRREAASSELDVAQAAADAVRAELATAEEAVIGARAAHDAAVEAVVGGPDRERTNALLEAHRQLGPLVEQGEEAATAADRASAERDAAAAQLGQAEAGREEAAETLEAARFRHGARALTSALVVGDLCPVCRQVVEAIADHDAADEVTRATEALREAKRQVEAAAETLRRAERRRAEAEADVARVRAERLPVETRLAEAGLGTAPPSPGDRHRLEADLARADALVAAAEAAAAAWREADHHRAEAAADPGRTQVLERARRAEQALAVAESRADTLTAAVAACRAEVDGMASRSRLEADDARAEQLLDAQREAVAAEVSAAQALVEAEARRDAARADAERLDTELATARDRVAALDPPVLRGLPPSEAWGRFVSWAEATARHLGVERSRLVDAESVVAAQLADLDAAVEGHLASAGLPARAGGDSDGALERIASARATTDAELADATRRATQQAERAGRLAAEAERASVAAELGRLLGAKGFEAWLLAEALDDLVERATDRLVALSGGQYSFAAGTGTEFRVVDHGNADEVRDVKTLSGGETFLASLALALALADSVSELATAGAPKLESIFLDEGFGTLDPEALDTVAAAIEELGAGGRLVGIVTHVRDLAERIPTRLEVTKGPSTSTVERVES